MHQWVERGPVSGSGKEGRVENVEKVEQCYPVWLHRPPWPAVVSHLGPVCIHISHQFLGQCRDTADCQETKEEQFAGLHC